MKQYICMIMIVVTITTAAAILPGLISGSMNSVMAQGQNTTAGNATAGNATAGNATAGNATAGNITETESITTAGETGWGQLP